MTRRMFSLALAFAFSFVMSLLVGGVAWNSAVWVFVLMFVYSLASVIIMRFTVKVDNSKVKIRAKRGAYLKISSQISSKFALPFSKVILNSHNEKIFAQVPVNGITEIEYDVYCPHCGRFSLAADKYWLTDAFGLFKIPGRKIEKISVTTVVPVVRQMKKRTDDAVKVHILPMKKTQEHEEMAGTHPFSDGDSVKNIHWKQSARRSELMTAEYEVAADNTILLLINRNCSDKKLTVNAENKADIAGEYAISVTSAALKNGKCVHSIIVTVDKTVKRDINFAQRMDDAEMDFAMLRPVCSNEMPFVSELLKSVESFASVVYICYELSKQTENLLSALRNSGVQVQTVIVGLNGSADIDTVCINDENDIENLRVPYGC